MGFDDWIVRVKVIEHIKQIKMMAMKSKSLIMNEWSIYICELNLKYQIIINRYQLFSIKYKLYNKVTILNFEYLKNNLIN